MHVLTRALRGSQERGKDCFHRYGHLSKNTYDGCGSTHTCTHTHTYARAHTTHTHAHTHTHNTHIFYHWSSLNVFLSSNLYFQFPQTRSFPFLTRLLILTPVNITTFRVILLALLGDGGRWVRCCITLWDTHSSIIALWEFCWSRTCSAE